MFLLNGSNYEKKWGGRDHPCRIIAGDKEKDKAIICPCKWRKDEIKEMSHCELFVK